MTFSIFNANNALYFTINNGFPRPLSLPKEKPKVKFNFPNIKLYNTNIHIMLSSDDMAGTSIIAGMLNILFVYLKGQSKVKLSDAKSKIDIKDGNLDIKFIVDFTIKYSLLKIIFAYLHMIVQRGYYRRKYGRQDRRTDGVHSR